MNFKMKTNEAAHDAEALLDWMFAKNWNVDKACRALIVATAGLLDSDAEIDEAASIMKRLHQIVNAPTATSREDEAEGEGEGEGEL